MAVSEMNYVDIGGDITVSASTSIPSGSTSIPINCKKGDVIFFAVTRSQSGYPFLWNPHNPVVSSDYIQNNADTKYYGEGTTNTFYFLLQASQENNIFSIYTGATMSGEYYIISND